MAIQLVLQGKKIDISESSITALIETSPATKSHKVGDYIYYNNIVYIVKLNIAIGDNLVVDTNIEVPILSEGTVVYIPQPGGGSVINGSNPNLLINPWFTVNQRGQSNYSISTYADKTYTVDDWKFYNKNMSVSIGTDGLTISSTSSSSEESYLRQRIENIDCLLGKTVTLSALMSDGELIQATGTLPSVLDDSVNITICNTYTSDSKFNIFFRLTGLNVSVSNNYQEVRIGVIGLNQSKTVRAVKLEVGSVSTLANDSAPDYTTELLKCQRYFVRYAVTDSVPLAYGVALTTTTFQIPWQFPVQMCALPTFNYSGTLSIVVAGGGKPISNMQVVRMASNIILYLYPTVSQAVTQGVIGMLQLSGSNSYIEFSAEL